MQLDILNVGTDETTARFLCGQAEAGLLMEACAALREARFPGVMERLPRMFDEEDLAKALGNEQQVAELLAIFELEQLFHQSLHLFPGGHHHHDEDLDDDEA